MGYEVLKSLKYSHDGINVIGLSKGDTLDTSDNVDALIKEGYLKKPSAKKAAPPAPIEEAIETKDVDKLDTSKPTPSLRVRGREK